MVARVWGGIAADQASRHTAHATTPTAARSPRRSPGFGDLRPSSLLGQQAPVGQPAVLEPPNNARKVMAERAEVSLVCPLYMPSSGFTCAPRCQRLARIQGIFIAEKNAQ